MTFGDIKTRIADELVRPDLASQISLAVGDAIKEAASNRFWFNQVRSLTFMMVPGQAFYSDTNYIEQIDSLWIIANGQRRNLERRNLYDIEGWNEGQDTLTGEPFAYARQGDGFNFWMPPNLAYPVYVDGTTRFAPLLSDTDENPYLTEGERYVRAIAKAIVLEDVIRDFDEADRQWTRVEREKTMLLRDTSSRMATNTLRASL